MGLDISHDTWHGSYGSFMVWRKMVAKLAGFPPLELMEGYFNPEALGSPFSFLYLSMYDTPENNILFGQAKELVAELPIKWSSLRKSPLIDLLYHSDCDGCISYGKAKKIGDKLKELLPLFPQNPELTAGLYWFDKTQQFIDGCYRAYEAKEKLQFH